MDTGKRQHLQDIYSSDRTERDEYTPQVSSETMNEHHRDIRRQKLTGFLLGTIILLLSVSLVFVVVREYMQITNLAPSPTPITQEYIPRYSLGTEAQWTLDYSLKFSDPKWDGEGERPLNSQWVKKAAYNLILAEQAVKINELEDAVTHYNNVLEIFPDIEGVKITLGMTYFKLQQFDQALELLRDAPLTDLPTEVLNNLGAACISIEAYDDAEKYLTEALALMPTYAEAQKNLAVLYKEQKRPEDAVEAYEKYIDLRPDDIDVQHNFALYLTKLGEWEKAAVVLDELTQKITNIPVLFFLLAQVETHNERPGKAMLALKRGIQLSDPNAALGYMDVGEFEQLRESDEFQGMIKALRKTQEK